jgi:DivIVA domain-containing protein
MKITSLDIRKQEFNRSFRGYDMDEVDSFLQVVANQWQEIVDDLRRSDEKISDQQLKLDHYMKVEEALEQALQTARSSARITIENAEMKARNTLEDAENRVVDLQKNADTERLQMKRDTAKYAVRQQEIVAKLRAFLMSEMEILSHFDSENIRPSLSNSTSLKEIELVKDETAQPSEPAQLTKRAESTPSTLPAEDLKPTYPAPLAPLQVANEDDRSQSFKDTSVNPTESENKSILQTGRDESVNEDDREGSKLAWEKLEEEVGVVSQPSAPLDNHGSEKGNWEQEEDEWEMNHEAEEIAEEEDSAEGKASVNDESKATLPAQTAQPTQGNRIKLEGTPSWKVTPIFESVADEDADEDDSDSHDSVSSNHEKQVIDSEMVSEEVGADDEAEAEIRKIHQILKDLDDE